MGTTAARGELLIIGGGEDKEGGMAILREFVRLAGGPEEARIVVMSVASEDHPAQDAKYREAFGKLGVRHFRSLRTETRDDADGASSMSVIDWATGVFFTGGDQKRILRLLRGTKLDRELHRLHERGLVIAGTSAGASMMSVAMMHEGSSDEGPLVGVMKLGEGMGFLPGVIVDQHFDQRGRLGRLLAAVAERPRDLGIGIDEDTAILVEGGRFRVLGSGVATVIDASRILHNDRDRRGEEEALTLSGLILHTVGKGYRFDLGSRSLIVDEGQKP